MWFSFITKGEEKKKRGREIYIKCPTEKGELRDMKVSIVTFVCCFYMWNLIPSKYIYNKGANCDKLTCFFFLIDKYPDWLNIGKCP